MLYAYSYLAFVCNGGYGLEVISMYLSEDEARCKLVEIGRVMYDQGYVVTNDGNLSIKLSDDTILITPTGVCKGSMNKEDMVVMGLDGSVIRQGALKPTSESKMHIRVYKENRCVRSVVHAHPVYATTYSILQRPLDKPYLMEAIMQLGVVPLAPYAKQGTCEVADSIAPYAKDYASCLLSNHGALTWGSDIDQAFSRMEVLENYARITYLVDSLGGASGLTQTQIDDLGHIMEDKGNPPLVLPKQLD